MVDGTIIYDNISRYLANFGEPALWACPIQQGLPILFNLLFIGLLWFGINAMIGVIRSNSLGLLRSFGDEESIKKSKEGLRNGVIGLLMVLISLFFFVMFVRGFLGVQYQIFDSAGKFNGFFVIRNAQGQNIDRCQERQDMFQTTNPESSVTPTPVPGKPAAAPTKKPVKPSDAQAANDPVKTDPDAPLRLLPAIRDIQS